MTLDSGVCSLEALFRARGGVWGQSKEDLGMHIALRNAKLDNISKLLHERDDDEGVSATGTDAPGATGAPPLGKTKVVLDTSDFSSHGSTIKHSRVSKCRSKHDSTLLPIASNVAMSLQPESITTTITS